MSANEWVKTKAREIVHPWAEISEEEVLVGRIAAALIEAEARGREGSDLPEILTLPNPTGKKGSFITNDALSVVIAEAEARGRTMRYDGQQPHANWGPCDGLGPEGSCSECWRLAYAEGETRGRNDLWEIWFNEGRDAALKEAQRQVCTFINGLDPNLRLDPVGIADRVIGIFRALKSGTGREENK